VNVFCSKVIGLFMHKRQNSHRLLADAKWKQQRKREQENSWFEPNLCFCPKTIHEWGRECANLPASVRLW
jgi:hypothetical protein